MSQPGSLRNYGLVTAAYWGFTLTDGALRMLVLLYFHGLGYTPLQIASLFLLYEFFGIVTNAVGGWLGSSASTPRYTPDSPYRLARSACSPPSIRPGGKASPSPT